ncbi:MAG TPA: ABC transporter ATP-binding protein [Stellaceae bacterium]|jgi:branched-chain amino acid transport system ATP-binding protein|nr:ABC transporter ATP-binding protein [Stellaceae bacterium]
MVSLLRLDNLAKSFGALKVIDGLSLSLGKGEALGILGPNGAGKSTMFNLITGDLQPSAGRIHFDGRDVTTLPAPHRCRLGIGRTYQIPHPFAGMSVFENVLVAAAFGNRRKEAQCYDRCVEVLELTGLLAKANLAAGSLTLLERKRLELARALATGPRALLLDEIAGGLTESECRELIRTVNGIRGNGLSIIWIEHIVHALLAVVERLVVIDFGKIVAEGAPAAVMADPAVQEIYLGIEAA